MFQVGDRVRLLLGVLRGHVCKEPADEGNGGRHANVKSCRVLFDGRTQPSVYHVSYLEEDEPCETAETSGSESR